MNLTIDIHSAYARQNNQIDFTYIKENKNLTIYAVVPENVKRVEFRLHSARNIIIDRFSDVSDRDPTVDVERRPTAKRDIWYPIVDIVRTPGLEGVMLFEEGATGEVIINGPFINRTEKVRSEISIPAEELVAWENTIVVDPLETLISDFYLRIPVPVVMRRAHYDFSLLSENWYGRISLYDVTDGRNRHLASVDVNREDRFVLEGAKSDNPGTEASPSQSDQQTDTLTFPGNEIIKSRLLQALDATIDFTLSSQVNDPGSPAHGGMFLFYDLDSGTYRNSYWMWGWGPSVRLLLDAAEQNPTEKNVSILRKTAEEIGRKSMEFKYLNENHILDQVPVGRWRQRATGDGDVYSAAITIADIQFLSGWAWIPLYELTEDAYFLQAAENLSRVTGELMESHFPVIIPHSFLPESDSWYDYTLNETGFGVEGLAELYRVTGDATYQDIGRKFIQQHQDVFQREDGLWDRAYYLNDGRTTPTVRLTRGLGWAMEGLLAAHRLDPEGGFLEHAERMANEMIKWQYPDGSWTFFMDVPAEERGISEKGTALWSYLLYRLYSYTNDENHLSAARMALIWCMNNQYLGPDKEAYGSIPGVTQHAAVGYRRFFKVSCAYTSGFFGLALLEELKMQ